MLRRVPYSILIRLARSTYESILDTKTSEVWRGPALMSSGEGRCKRNLLHDRSAKFMAISWHKSMKAPLCYAAWWLAFSRLQVEVR
jgi:hypothetical protein